MTIRKGAAIAVALLLSLAAIGCGSTKDDGAGSADAGEEKQSDASTSSTSETSDELTSTSEALEGLNGLAAGELGDCLSIGVAYASLSPLTFLNGATEEQLDKFEQDTADLQSKIPAELRNDFATVAEAYQAYGEALKGLDPTDLVNADTQQKLAEAGEKLEEPDVKEAQERIDAYFDGNCGKSP